MSFTRNDDRSGGRMHVIGTVSGQADITLTGSVHTGKTFTPDSASIQYAKRGNRVDGPWTFYGITVSGFLHKKDGTPGALRGDVYYGPNTIDRAAEWMRILIRDQQPDPLLTALTGSLKAGIFPDGPTGERLDALYLAVTRRDTEELAALSTALTDAAGIVGRAVGERITRSMS